MTANEKTEATYHVDGVNVETNRHLIASVKYSGQIQMILGPMFSGKTTYLIRRLKRYQLANQKCLIKYHHNNAHNHTG